MPLVTCTLTPDLERQEETRQRPRSLSGQSMAPLPIATTELAVIELGHQHEMDE